MCDSNNFGDGNIDFASSNQSLMMQQRQRQMQPPQQGYEQDLYEGDDVGADDYSYDMQSGGGGPVSMQDPSTAFAGSRMSILNGAVGQGQGHYSPMSPSDGGFTFIGANEQHQQGLDTGALQQMQQYGGDGAGEYFDEDDEGFMTQAVGPKNFLVPFEITVCPEETEGDFVQWKLSDAYYEPFQIPGNKEFTDEAILAGVDVYNVTSNFPADVALQVSMKKEGTSEVDRENPESFVGERLYGPMGLGSHKKMTVHAKISPNDKQDFCVLAGAEQYTKSFLEELNAHSIKNNKPVWTESHLRSKGIHPGKRGNLLVERDHPVISYIANRMPGPANFTEAGTDHFTVSKKTFNRAVNNIMSEASVNIKLGDARKNLRIFAMRLVPSKGKMAESAWKDERGLFDMVTGSTEEAQESAKRRILGKKYSIKGNLCLNYIPIVNF